MSIEAMKQALEALGCIESPLQVWEINKLAGAMNALRQAIEFEEMVKKGTKAWADTPDGWVDDLRGGVEKQEPVGYLYDWLNPDNRDEVIRDWFAASMYVIEKDKGFNVRPLYTAPVHATENAEEQEPVAFRNINTGEFCTGGFLRKDWAKWQPLYAAPVHASENAEKQEPVAWMSVDCVGERYLHFSKPLDNDPVTPLYTAPVHAVDMSQERVDETAKRKHEWVGFTAAERDEIVPMLVQSLINHDDKTMTVLLRAILIDVEEQLKEKNGYGSEVYGPPTDFISPSVVKAISKREWVGLTKKEAWECWVSQDHTKSWQNIEAKLKEKNT